MGRVDAVIVSHDHVDHVRCAGIYQRKFGLPVWVTARTLRAAAAQYGLGHMTDIRHFDAGSAMRFGSVSVETIRTPHDGVDGVAFVVDDGRHRLGILTDLGHVFAGLDALVGSLDAVLIESNYDPRMLATGSYPEAVKRRIRGPGGHLSNVEAAELLRASAASRMKWACLGHLSEQNNNPELALRTHRHILGRRLVLHVASRHEATDVLEV
jgi:phosphoribosyl 1,2-cyclic phosphodiesterase